MKQLSLEIVGEGGVTICRDPVKCTMAFKHIIHEHMSDCIGLEGVF